MRSNTFRTTGNPDVLGLRGGESVLRASAADFDGDRSTGLRRLLQTSLLGLRGHATQADAASTSLVSGSSHLHRPTLLRQHRLRRSVGLLLRLAASLAEARLPRPLRHARRAQGRGAGRHALPPRQQGEGRGVLPRRHDAGDAPPRRAGTPGLSGHHLLRLQAVRERRR